MSGPLDQLLVLYASDLEENSQIAPGGVTNNIRNYLPFIPEPVDIEVWGAAHQGAYAGLVTRVEGGRSYRFRALCSAEPVAGRKVPLNLRYMGRLALAAARHRFAARSGTLVFAHRMEYVVALAASRPIAALPPIVLFVHGSSRFSSLCMPPWKAAAYGRLERIAVARARKVVMVSRDAFEDYHGLYPRHAHKLVHIPNPVDTERFKPLHRQMCRAALGLPGAAPVFVYHGRLEPEKGVYLLLDTFRAILERLPGAHLLVVGDGSERAGLARTISQQLIPNVRLVGPVPHGEIPKHLCAADVSLLTSRFEGMSNGVLESLACGVPVVATAVGDNAQLVFSGRSGELCVQHEAADLADAAVRVFAGAASMQADCVAIASRFSPQARVARFLELAAEIQRVDAA